MIDIVLHRLHYHDGIIYHNANSQHKGKHGKGIDGKTQRAKQDKSTYQRNRDGQHRDKRCSPILQKQEHHEHYQY